MGCKYVYDYHAGKLTIYLCKHHFELLGRPMIGLMEKVQEILKKSCDPREMMEEEDEPSG